MCFDPTAYSETAQADPRSPSAATATAATVAPVPVVGQTMANNKQHVSTIRSSGSIYHFVTDWLGVPFRITPPHLTLVLNAADPIGIKQNYTKPSVRASLFSGRQTWEIILKTSYAKLRQKLCFENLKSRVFIPQKYFGKNIGHFKEILGKNLK